MNQKLKHKAKFTGNIPQKIKTAPKKILRANINLTI